MKHKKLIRSTNAQINFLINYMSSHKIFANASMGAKNMAEEWSYLRGLLKAHGPDKSVDQWKTTWRDLKRKARKQNAVASRAATEEVEHMPVASSSTIKVLDTIGQEISNELIRESTPDPLESPERDVDIHSRKSPVPQVKVVSMHRRRRRLPPEVVPGHLQAQNQRNALLQKLCDLVAEQNSILRERNQIERKKLYLQQKPEIVQCYQINK